MFTYTDIIENKRPVSKHIPMDITHRAKIFAPFAALKGFETAIKKKERLFVHRMELVDEQKGAINHALQELSVGDEITVTYFVQSPDQPADIGTYCTVTGPVNLINRKKLLILLNDTMICFKDIADILS